MSSLFKLHFVILGFLNSVSCTSLLYYPNSYLYVDDKKLDLPPLEIDLSAAGQDDLLSWYFEAQKKSRKSVTIVFSHGNGQNISAHFRSLYWILNQGFNFLIVGYPGYGPNKGSPSPRSTVDTVIAAIKWVEKNRPEDAILVFGQSLGGNIALRAVSEYKDVQYCGVAIEGSFLSYKKVAQQTMARSWLLWSFQWLPYILVSDAESIAQNINELPKTQYLIIHGKNDPSVSYQLGTELFNQLPEPKQFWSIEKGKHIDTFAKYPLERDKFVDFVKLNCLSQKK